MNGVHAPSIGSDRASIEDREVDLPSAVTALQRARATAAAINRGGPTGMHSTVASMKDLDEALLRLQEVGQAGLGRVAGMPAVARGSRRYLAGVHACRKVLHWGACCSVRQWLVSCRYSATADATAASRSRSALDHLSCLSAPLGLYMSEG